MGKRFWITAAIVAVIVLLAPPQANAEVRFGVTIGHPYAYSYPVYRYSYSPYYYDPYYYRPYVAYPYVYRYPAYRSYYVNPGRSYVFTYRSGSHGRHRGRR